MRTRVVFVVLLTLSGLACGKHRSPSEVASPRGEGERVAFVAKVLQVSMIDEAGGFMPVAADPRFRLVVTVLSADHPEFPFQSGTHVLGIHSPSQLQLDAGSVNGVFRFTVDWVKVDDETHRLTGLRNEGEVR